MTDELGEVDSLPAFDVAVAIQSTDSSHPRLPGYSEASEQRLRQRAADLVVKGDAAVKLATEAIASQIGITAQRIAASIDAQTLTEVQPGKLGVDCVEVAFGVTLSGGVQALFTAQGESSAQVTVTLTRRSAVT
jgi:hypothetical protein